ncbi:hypothetical protein [Dietzia sp. 179-F 9C3 NHS]|uniref:hypothetical protein n=1 Tax=Dietzia sp. 179-F 9C3 NHS TaxID=3374295 RepID=UPI003879BB70
MSARLRSEVPPVVTSLVGVVVAMVSAVFGISAHGLAAGAAATAPTSGQILSVLAAGAGIGAVTAALARHRSPVPVAAAGLVAGQGLVHLVLASGHAHGPAGHTHGADAATVRAAMDATAVTPHDLWTPAMLGAHAAAIVVTLAVVAVLARTLAWVAARVAPLLGRILLAAADLVVVPTLPTPVPDPGYLLARGGTRAPPVAV